VLHLGRYANAEVARRVTLLTQAQLFEAVTKPDGVAQLEDPAFQDRLRLAQAAAQSGPQQLVGAVLAIGQATLTVAGFLVALLAISPLATVLVLASAMPTLWAQLKLGRQRTAMMVRITPNTRRQLFYSMLLLDVRAAKEIRLFGLGDFFRGRMLTELGVAQDGERGVDRRTLRVDGSLSLLTAAVSGVALILTVARIGDGSASIGDISILIAALAGVQGTLAGIVSQIAMLDQMLSLFSHYTTIVRSAQSAVAGPTAQVAPLRTGIELRDVWFRYHPDHEWILRGVNLTLEHGQSVALVGLNGAGKSTLIKLLCRLYEPTQGTITWDGQDVREMDTTALRARIGVVFQDYMSYEMSAAENIAVGDLGAEERQLHHAAEAAGIGATLAALPRGYRTMLSRMFGGDDSDADGPGVSLSGGQWQRVAIARAVLRTDADLLILDEPSAGLDAIAEDDIQRSLRRLRSGRSSLLISHRLNTVRAADRIAVIEDGRIVEEGTHDALMAVDSQYARLFRMQADGYQLAPQR
jgi:ATP-binding cassette subfamily B protein